MKALVIGAGVAGLSAAIALRRCGWSVDVFEREAVLRAEGAGIQLGANAVGALKQLGAFGAIADAARQPEAVRLLDGPTGRALADIPFGRFSEARYGNPNLLLRRADLVAGLAEAAQLAGADLNFSAKVDVADAASGQVSVNGTLMQADLVLGADGLYSRCRALFDVPAPRYTGHIAWRALFRPDSTPDPITRNWMFPDRHIVYYPVGQGDDLAMNLVAFTPSATPQAEDWDATAPQDALLEKFPDACREVRWLIEATDVIGVWGIYAHQIPNWVSGRLCLIGDAAHPTTPYLAQGAGMALEDAACLMACLDSSSDLSDRLAQFSAIRKPRTDKVTQQSFRSGAIYHKGGLVRHARNIVLRSSKGARLLKRLDWLYGYDSSTQTGT